jgi:hypothetical protein
VDTSLDHLTPEMKPLAMELLARCVEARIFVVVIRTLTTPEEEQAEIDSGHSWTHHSEHLPQEPSGLSDAIDVAPLLSYLEGGGATINWDNRDANWAKVIAIGEKIGLHSGKNFPKPDLGHFQRVKPNG